MRIKTQEGDLHVRTLVVLLKVLDNILIPHTKDTETTCLPLPRSYRICIFDNVIRKEVSRSL